MLLLTSLAFARGGYETNHPEVEWHTLETEHFYFHWPESGLPEDDPHWFTAEWTASALADIAETSYPLICAQFDHFLVEKTHVVVYDQDTGWQGNGFAIAEMDWTGFAAEWGPLFRERGRMEFLSDVFVHEFAHIVSLKAYLPWSEGTTWLEIGGLSEDEEWVRRWGYKPEPGINVDLGASFLMSAHTPFWWAEGGAEYWSHQAGYNFWGTSRDAYLRMTVLEDRVLDHDEWTTRIDKEGMDGERGYNQGYSFGLYLRDRFGVDTYGRMAAINAERWRWSWDTVVEEATGVESEQLHADWKLWLEGKYAEQKATIEARAPIVEGEELSVTQPIWLTPEWEDLDKGEREVELDGDSAWVDMPIWSADGQYLAWFGNGLEIVKGEPGQWGALGGVYVDEEDSKAVDAYDRRHTSDYWVRNSPVAFSGDRLVAVGSEDWAPEWRRNQGFTFNADGYTWNQLLVGTLSEDPKKGLEVEWTPVPNTLRATEATWSPDGEWLYFARYHDGSQDLWRIKPDGTEGEKLTDFGDGTQFQGLSFTPDGRGLVTGIYRNYQQDIVIYEVETGEFWRVTDTEADETDPKVGPDGRIWFTSDLDGVYNVYSLDLETRVVERQTNVYGGAYGASVAPSGDLAYTAITGHGFKVKLVKHADLLGLPWDYPGLCGIDFDACQDDKAWMEFRPDLPDASALSVDYKARKAQFPVTGWPIARLSDKNVEVGAGFAFGDYSEAHYIDGQLTVGKDNWIAVSYWNNTFWPSLMVGFSRYSYKGTYGYGIDQDELPETNDIYVVDVKFEQLSDDVYASASYLPSDSIWISVGGDMSRYSFRDNGDGDTWVPYVVSSGVGFYAEWSPQAVGYGWGDDWINPRGGRRVYVDYQHRWSNLVDKDIAGFVYDDGDGLESYAYNRVQLSYSEFLPVGWFGLTDHHTLQLDFEGGYIDRNVMGWDEFVAGGRHPYHWGSGTIGNNVQFAGFEGWSLTGETMLIANASYRFPLLRDMNLKTGPVYTDTVYMQVYGSIGNLWSYRVEGPTHVEGYSVVPDGEGQVRREVPFQDYAAKNSAPGSNNYYLSDVGVEFRVRQFIWNDWDWDSFVRLAYGMQPTGGYGDVNADLIQSSVARDAASELSTEVEDSTVRVYVGLGTGW